MSATPPIVIGKRPDGHELRLLPAMANRHGLIAGATGTGKTVTLQVLAEAFSRIGVPVFLADVKGDLAGIGQPGGGNAEDRGARRRSSALGALATPAARSCSGTSSASRAIRCARRSPRWGRCCSAACST